ncbi:unnamed protein product [Closterium sp. NIES-53]
MATPTVLAFDAVGHPLGFDSWLEGLHLYLHSVTSHDVSLFEHTSGSLQAAKAPAEPAADAWEEVRTQFRAAHLAYKRWMARDATATLAVHLHLSFDQRANFRQVSSAHAMYSAVVRRYSLPPPATLSFLLPSLRCAVPAEAFLSVPVTLADPTSGLVSAHPSDSSGSTEGGDPAAANSATSWCSPRLETPHGFPPRTSSPPLQPVVVDFGGPGVVGDGDAEGAGFGGTGSEGAGSEGPRGPLVGGVGGSGAGAGGVPRSGGPGVCAGGAGSGGVSQSLPRRPIFLEQPSSSLPESALHHFLRIPLASAEPTTIGTPPPLLFPAVPDPVYVLVRAASPTIPRCLAAHMDCTCFFDCYCFCLST